MNKEYKSIVVMNTLTREYFEIVRKVGEDCDDFYSLPGSRVIMLTEDGYLLMYKYDKQKMTSKLISKIHFKLSEERKEVAITMCVCPKNEIVAVVTRVKRLYHISRVFLFRIDDPRLEKPNIARMAELDLYDKSTIYFCAMTFYKYINNALILTGMTRDKNSKVITLIYDGKEFKEYHHLRAQTSAVNPRKIVMTGEDIIGADDLGKVFAIKYIYGE